MLDDQTLVTIVLLGTGATVGFACGLLGVGGGFLMVPVQIWALTYQGIDPTLATRIAFGTSLAVILPTAISGCYGHSCRGVVLWRPGIIMGLARVAGAFLGGTIASHAPADLLQMAFGLVVIMGALRMLFARNLRPKADLRTGFLIYALSGAAVGVISGLTGIGGGVILVPVMVSVLGFSMLQAVGTSSLAIAFNAVGGTLAYAINGLHVEGLPPSSIGYIDLMQFVLLASTSVLGAQLGVRVAHKLPGEQLRYIFIALMMYVGLKMIGFLSWMGLSF